METETTQTAFVDSEVYESEPLLAKYEELFICVSQLYSFVNDGDLIGDGASILHALEQSHSISAEIQLQEQDEVYAAAHVEIANQLSWNHRMLSTIISRRKKPVSCTPRKQAPQSGEDGEQSDKKEEARKKAIEATRQEPMVDGLISVAGLTEVKKILWETGFLPSKFPHLFKGARRPGNCILLYGPPGTGKTRLAHAFASEINATFYSVSSSDLLSSWVGESEKYKTPILSTLKHHQGSASSLQSCWILQPVVPLAKDEDRGLRNWFQILYKLIRELFITIGQQEERSVIFIDEVDSICRQRSVNEDDLSRRLKTELFVQFEKCGNKSNIHVMCATNCPWEIDSALLRRFHNSIYIPLPKREERAEIFLMHIQDMHYSITESEWEILLNCTEGYSGSDIANLTRNALLEPVREMVDTTSWIKTPNGDYIPCSSSHPAAIKSSIYDLPADKVTARNVILDDFLKARTTARPTVTSRDNEKFEQFTARHGQRGHTE